MEGVDEACKFSLDTRKFVNFYLFHLSTTTAYTIPEWLWWSIKNIQVKITTPFAEILCFNFGPVAIFRKSFLCIRVKA
jgi:hypothetical protein